MASDPFPPGEPVKLLVGGIVALAGVVATLFWKLMKVWEERVKDHKEHTDDLMESQRLMGETREALKAAYKTKNAKRDDC